MFEDTETTLQEAAEAWQRWEAGMDWDASYLSSMGTMDSDTEEFFAVFSAMGKLEQACAQALESTKAEDIKVGSIVEKAQATLQAYYAYNDAGWDVWTREGEAAKLAARVSELLGVPFIGRCGGGSTNGSC